MAQYSIQQAFDLAIQHHQAGRLREAEQLYRQILAQQPEHADAIQFLGLLAQQEGRNELAIELIRRAVALRPQSAEAYANLGAALGAAGRFDEAISACRQAIVLDPKSPEAYSNLGNALTKKGDLDHAIEACRKAISLRPDYPEAFRNLGVALREAGQTEEAVAAFRRCIALGANTAEAHCELGIALDAARRFDEAVVAYRNAIALRPGFTEAHNNLGGALLEKRQFDDAIAAYRQAIALDPHSHNAHYNLGMAYGKSGRFDEAIAAYRQAISLEPEFPDAHNNLSYALLSRGDFEQGWRELDWRWKCKDLQLPARDFSQPLWDGSPFQSRTLLIQTELGFGDALQFIRYLPQAAERGGRIIIECQKELQRLFQIMAPTCAIVARGQPLPPFDLHCPMLTLPRIFGTTPANVPNAFPYLSADPRDTAKWRQRLAGRSPAAKVGLVWAGSPYNPIARERTIELEKLAPLGRTPGVQFFSLQKGAAALEARTPPPPLELVDWTDELADFADTAALVSNLDLVIAVDTSVAHLAGAMGRQVWTLVRFLPDFRWLAEREDRPWYPTMRLFRQSTRGDWDSVIARMADALSIWVCDRT